MTSRAQPDKPRIQPMTVVTSLRPKAPRANPPRALSRRAPKAAQEIGRGHRPGSASSSLVPAECSQGTTEQGVGPSRRGECGERRGNSAQLAPLMRRPGVQPVSTLGLSSGCPERASRPIPGRRYQVVRCGDRSERLRLPHANLRCSLRNVKPVVAHASTVQGGTNDEPARNDTAPSRDVIRG